MVGANTRRFLGSYSGISPIAATSSMPYLSMVIGEDVEVISRHDVEARGGADHDVIGAAQGYGVLHGGGPPRQP